MPTDNILEALDEPEDYIVKKLQDINEAVDPEKDVLDLAEESDNDIPEKNADNIDQSQDDDDYDYGEEDEEEYDYDNGIKNKTDP